MIFFFMLSSHTSIILAVFKDNVPMDTNFWFCFNILYTHVNVAQFCICLVTGRYFKVTTVQNSSELLILILAVLI